MLPKLPLADWQHILIDTSILVDYFSDPNRHEKNPIVKKRIEITKSVINALAELELPEKKKRSVYVSAVTLGELRKLPQIDNANIIAEALLGLDVVFIDYSKRVATDLLFNLEKYLPDGKKFQFIAHLEKVLKTENVASARQWIEDDMKIAACAKSLKRIDAVLTSDKRTFVPVADLMELPCIYMSEENFPKDIFGNLDLRGTQTGKKK